MVGFCATAATLLALTTVIGIVFPAKEGGGIGRESVVLLKKGRVLFPQPGILTTHPDEISNKTKSIAEKMERLLKVSRNRVAL